MQVRRHTLRISSLRSESWKYTAHAESEDVHRGVSASDTVVADTGGDSNGSQSTGSATAAPVGALAPLWASTVRATATATALGLAPVSSPAPVASQAGTASAPTGATAMAAWSLAASGAGATGVPSVPVTHSVPARPSDAGLVLLAPPVAALRVMPPNKLLPAELGDPANKLLLALVPGPDPNKDPELLGVALVAGPGKSAATGGSGGSSNRSRRAGDGSAAADLHPHDNNNNSNNTASHTRNSSTKA